MNQTFKFFIRTIILLIVIQVGNAQIQFSYTGDEQIYVVPAGVSAIQIEVWGAQGGGSEGFNTPNQDDGGLGGYAKGLIFVSEGDELFINVGGKPVMIPGGGNSGGFNGGGDSGQYGGAGGGATDVRLNGNGLFNRIIVAGGGGGGNTGNPDFGAGGAGGGLIGGDGISHRNLPEPTGGTQSEGGSGTGSATQGSLGNGGTYVNGSSAQVAGGGGGYYGGGAGFLSGGAGGSSYIGGMLEGFTESGIRSSNGLVIISEILSNAVGSITTGNAKYQYLSFSGSNNFLINSEDVLFGDRWFYRISGDTQEFKFPVPDFTTEFIEDTAVLTWLDVGGRGLFSAQLIQVIEQTKATGASISNRMTIKNLTTQNMQFDLFHYADFDVGGISNDEAVLVSGNDYIQIFDNNTSNKTNMAEFRANANLAYQVNSFGILNELLRDNSITVLNDSGLPFGPGDFTGAFQWSEFMPPFSTLIIESSMAAGDANAPLPAQPIIILDLIYNNGFEEK